MLYNQGQCLNILLDDSIRAYPASKVGTGIAVHIADPGHVMLQAGHQLQFPLIQDFTSYTSVLFQVP